MEWIKAIIEKYKKEDGTIDMTKAMDEINQEFPKNAVPKTVYNQTSEDLKAANKLVKDLKKDNKDVEELQNKINDYEKEVDQLKGQRLEERKTYSLKEALTKAGAKDVDYMIYKLGDVELDKEGNIIELENKVKSLKESNPSFFEVKDDTKNNDKSIEGKDTKGYEVIDNSLENGKPSDKEPKSLADAIKSQYEEK